MVGYGRMVLGHEKPAEPQFPPRQVSQQSQATLDHVNQPMDAMEQTQQSHGSQGSHPSCPSHQSPAGHAGHAAPLSQSERSQETRTARTGKGGGEPPPAWFMRLWRERWQDRQDGKPGKSQRRGPNQDRLELVKYWRLMDSARCLQEELDGNIAQAWDSWVFLGMNHENDRMIGMML